MKKLSLKRKHPQDKKEIKKNKLDKNSQSNDNDNNKLISSISLESEEDVIIQTEQREGEVVNGRTQRIEKKSAFLNTGNPSLDKLREMLISVTSKSNTLAPFPQLCDHHLSVERENSNNINSNKGKQLVLSEVEKVVGLPPLPKVCSHCRTRNNRVTTSCEMDISSSSSKELDGDKDEPCKVEQIGSKNSSIYAHQNKMGESDSSRKQNDSFTYRENNCNLLRDRNSNIYSLQSQNNNICSANYSNPTIGQERENTLCNDLHRNSSVKPSSSKIMKSGKDSHSGNGFDAGSPTVAECIGNKTVENKEPAVSVKPDTVLLKCCPMCQTQFSDRQNQMDIDSHIASCLAAADDNITW